MLGNLPFFFSMICKASNSIQIATINTDISIVSSISFKFVLQRYSFVLTKRALLTEKRKMSLLKRFVLTNFSGGNSQIIDKRRFLKWKKK